MKKRLRHAYPSLPLVKAFRFRASGQVFEALLFHEKGGYRADLWRRSATCWVLADEVGDEEVPSLKTLRNFVSRRYDQPF